MELLQLKYFCDAAKGENFSVTAKKFMVPPSSVSQSIKRLESELGATLFLRNANRISLSDQGRMFYEKAEAALALLSDAKRQFCDSEECGRIKLSIFINRRIVMQTVEKFSRLYPRVDIVTKYIASPEDEDFDLIVTDGELGVEYRREKLIEEEILLAVHRNHPLAQKETVEDEDLLNAPFITTNQGSSLHDITQDMCREMGFSPRIVICSDDPYYIRKCVELGLGVALVPARSWQGQFTENVVMKRVRDYRRVTYVYRHAKKYLPKSAERFLQMLRAEFATEG